MKKIADILPANNVLKKVSGNTDIVCNQLRFNSAQVEAEDVFIAIKGQLTDGHKYIKDALNKGAVAIVYENEEFVSDLKNVSTLIHVSDSRSALAQMAAAYYDYPSEQLNLIGITGTNGKTTIATLLYQLTESIGYKSGLLSTIQNISGDETVTATLTTPDPIEINSILYRMVQNKCDYCFMEVSSHAVDQKRIEALSFAGGIFTNLSHDHLDYHKTFDAYLKAKKQFFDYLPSSAFALINADDRNGKVMIQNSKAKKYTYGLKSMSDFKAKVLEQDLNGMKLLINEHEIYCRLTGAFNAYNLLAVYAAATLMEFEELKVLEAVSLLKNVEGRLEVVNPGAEFTGIVDFAHTPDAIENVLKTLMQMKSSGFSPVNRIFTVVGCGGNRDKTKRPLMGKIAVQYSDKVIFTSDNPRDEEPETIINEMFNGVKENFRHKALKISDRTEAIKTACSFLQKGDVVLVLGKGHEKYQEIKGKKIPFDDKEILINTLNQYKA